MQKKNQNASQEGRRKALENALRAWVRNHFVDTFGPKLEREIDLSLEFKLQPDLNCSFPTSLEDQMMAQLQTALADSDAFQKGHVFCFRCESAHCEHSQPDSATEVFANYDELGCPRWTEFTQSLLNAGDERVDQLYLEPPAVLTRFSEGSLLQNRRLSAFGMASKTYVIICQVTLGFIVLYRDYPEKVALTFQAVERRERDGARDIQVHLLKSRKDDWVWDSIRANPDFDWLVDALRKCRKTISTLLKKPQNAAWLEKTKTTMRQFQRDLDQGQRKTRSKTRHAHERKRIARPTSSAFEDLTQASSERFFCDTRTAAIAVLGPKGRCHIFSQSGRHITSFHITMDSVQARLNKRRWRHLNKEDRLHFLEQLHKKE